MLFAVPPGFVDMLVAIRSVRVSHALETCERLTSDRLCGSMPLVDVVLVVHLICAPRLCLDSTLPSLTSVSARSASTPDHDLDHHPSTLRGSSLLHLSSHSLVAS